MRQHGTSMSMTGVVKDGFHLFTTPHDMPPRLKGMGDKGLWSRKLATLAKLEPLAS